MSNPVVVSRDMEDPTVVKVDLSAECTTRFKCSTIDVAEQLLRSLQTKEIDFSVSLAFPGNSF